MKKKFLSLLSVFMIITLLTTPVSAEGAVKFSGRATFSLGSLDAAGFLILGGTDVQVILEASGVPEVTCTNQGSNSAPGQNPPNISATGAQALQPQTRNGKTPFDVSAEPPATLPGSQGGCPNDKWTAHIGFVYWNWAQITVTNAAGDTVLLQQSYTCTTTRNPDMVTCDPN